MKAADVDDLADHGRRCRNGDPALSAVHFLGGEHQHAQADAADVIDAREIDHDGKLRQPSACLDQWREVRFLFQLTNDEIHNYVSICAPYLEVVEEMTLKEFLEFHHHFKRFLPSLNINYVISVIGLENAANKQIRFFSSGMRQRVKLAQAFFSDTPLLLLDEPCTNLDAPGIELYHGLIKDYCANRLVIISSNDEVEYSFCKELINVVKYKN